jgi:UvrD/REP helicase N-terminal domain
MRFLAVEKGAADEIISDRLLQSVDFDSGRALAEFIQNLDLSAKFSSRLRVDRRSDGVFLLPGKGDGTDFVVFDLERCGLFEKQQSPPDSLLYFQKVLRFAVKYWGNLRLSATEKIFPNSTRAVVFPFPISQHTSFRISIELAPDERRQARRSPEGRSVLVYRSGVDEGGGLQEKVQLTNFRRFVDAKQVVTAESSAGEPGTPPHITSLTVTALDASLVSKISPYQGYEKWLELLTVKQKKFVLADLDAPHRIEGPAGTGKTLCLVLKSIAGLHAAVEANCEHKALFITHSEATRRTVQQLVETNDQHNFLNASAATDLQSLELTTLQQLCAGLLQRDVSETEFLDRDAMESKQLQLLYVNEAFNSVMREDYETYKKILSPQLNHLLKETDPWAMTEMLQHEISVVIKGRAEEQLENYRKLPPLKYGLPAAGAADRGFIWIIFRQYQSQLQTAAQFDTDDIVLTTIGQLDTPIWRRRREREGYDAIYIDETHLFNMNELSLFHYLSRSDKQYPIAYSVDRSQAIGDRGWTDELFEEIISPDTKARQGVTRTVVRGIFRCSPEIINLAFSVTSAGATLFTNFDDPLKLATSMFTGEEERKSSPPRFVACTSDEEMIIEAFLRAEKLTEEMGVHRGDVALIAFTDELFKMAHEYAIEHTKPLELLKQRGDIELVQRAQKSGRFVLSTPEYVGGLEFDGAILIGVDDGRVPPTKTLDSPESTNFLNYAAHNRLYVSITRARYRIEILGVKDRGPSPLLSNALDSNILLRGS